MGLWQYHVDTVITILLLRQEVHIQVDVQFAHLTVIVSIALPIIGIVGMVILMRAVSPRLIVFRLHPHIIIPLELVMALHSGSYGMLFVQLPVETQIVVQSLSVPVVADVAVLKNVLDGAVVCEEGGLLDAQVVGIIPPPVVHHSEEIDIIVTIAQVQRTAGVAETECQILVVGSHQIEAETLTISPYRLDAHHS